MNEVMFDSPLDEGIAAFVKVLVEAGIETYESCEGGEGHAYPEPTIRFHGGISEGFRAYAVALQYDLPVSAIRRTWNVVDGELTGPTWEITLYRKVRLADPGPGYITT